jgi:F-type H+-transporting ATPase subunit epsilon
MNLKILLPYRIYTQQKDVVRIVAETSAGSFGVLPQRLDCAAVLVPGILTYEIASQVTYVALDAGVLVKAGAEVLISVRRALAGTDLVALQAAVRHSFLNVDKHEQEVRAAVAKMEAALVTRVARLQHDR